MDAVSATAFDEKNGEQYADLLTNGIMTGHGIEEVNALEKEMDADEIYWADALSKFHNNPPGLMAWGMLNLMISLWKSLQLNVTMDRETIRKT